jgi:secondary thiamine-phosphate synthase enzyme
MKTYRKELWFNIPKRRDYVNITQQVESCIKESGINDDEKGLHKDFESWLERLAPERPYSQYRHNDTGEDNADAHLKRTVMGREVIVALTNGQLDFGPWEQIFYGEFDGKRRKRVLVKIIGE